MGNFVDPKTVPSEKLYTGETMPCIGLGTFGSDRYTPETEAAAVAGAIRCGYRLIDCAAAYGNEPQIGQVLTQAFEEGIVKRDELFLMSKVWNNMHRRVKEACKKTLSDLKQQYLDMYFIHWPFPNYHAPHAAGDSRAKDAKPFSAEEYLDTYRQMEELYQEGLIRHIGISNMTIAKLDQVLPEMKIRPAACELEFHPCFQQRELFAYLGKHGILPVGFMPLGSPQRPERDMDSTDVSDLQTDIMKKIAEKHQVHPALIALKWSHQKGAVPIPFSVHENEYFSNLEAVTRDPLTAEEMALIGTLECGNRLARGQVFLWPEAKDWHALWDE